MANIFEKLSRASTVFVNKAFLLPSFTPSKLPFRENQVQLLSEHLSGLAIGERVSNLFLYGKVGTGKTVVTKFVLRELESFCKARSVPCTPVYINCRNHATKFRVLHKIASALEPDSHYLGFSASVVFERIVALAASGRHLVLALDEIDRVADVDELVYSLSRANDELPPGASISIIGISNNALLKDRLDARTKSSLCEHEIVFKPYNATELQAILFERAASAFLSGAVSESAIQLASALAARESGDCRSAVLLLSRAGEIADKANRSPVTDADVLAAREDVERELIFRMIATLPRHHKMVLYAIADLSGTRQGVQLVNGKREEGLLFSGDIYEQYSSLAKQFGDAPVSARWYREAVSELETYGVIVTSASGKGIRGQTRLVKLAVNAPQLRVTLDTALRDEHAP